MTYYRVKQEYDGTRCLAYNKKRNFWYYDRELVANELYTKKELDKFNNKEVYKFVTPVEIKKTNAYFFFGRRFQLDKENRPL